VVRACSVGQRADRKDRRRIQSFPPFQWLGGETLAILDDSLLKKQDTEVLSAVLLLRVDGSGPVGFGAVPETSKICSGSSEDNAVTEKIL